MALINCPECGKEVSDKASSCPNCGYELNQEKNSKKVMEGSKEEPVGNTRRKSKKVIVVASIVILLLSGIVFSLSYYNAYSKCEEICVMLDDIHYSTALEELDNLSQSTFTLCGTSITEKYIEIVCSNKVEGKVPENGVGIYLDMEDYEFSRWSQLKRIGYKLKELGAENIDNYISYAEGVINLRKYSEYDEIIRYINSLRFEALFDSVFSYDLNQRSALNINAKLNSYDYSGLNTNDKYCKKLYDYLMDYNEGIVDYYNGNWAGYGYSVAVKGENKIKTTLLGIEDFLLDIGEAQVDLINDINSLPAI